MNIGRFHDAAYLVLHYDLHAGVDGFWVDGDLRTFTLRSFKAFVMHYTNAIHATRRTFWFARTGYKPCETPATPTAFRPIGFPATTQRHGRLMPAAPQNVRFAWENGGAKPETVWEAATGWLTVTVPGLRLHDAVTSGEAGKYRRSLRFPGADMTPRDAVFPRKGGGKLGITVPVNVFL